MTIAPLSETQKTVKATATERPPAAATTPADGGGFEAALAGEAAKAVAAPEASITLGIERRGHQSGQMSPAQTFEGFVLRTFVEQMLPSENAEFFGEGMAGNVWRSMMAEQLGDELARAGGIGIAEMIGDKTPQASVRAEKAGESLASADDALALKLPAAR